MQEPEKSRSEQREMLNFSAVTAKAPANSIESSGAKVAHTSCSELWKDDVAYTLTSIRHASHPSPLEKQIPSLRACSQQRSSSWRNEAGHLCCAPWLLLWGNSPCSYVHVSLHSPGCVMCQSSPQNRGLQITAWKPNTTHTYFLN